MSDTADQRHLIQVQVDADTFRRVTDHCDRIGVSRAVWVRLLIAQALGNDPMNARHRWPDINSSAVMRAGGDANP